jgi:hypothetical protein
MGFSLQLSAAIAERPQREHTNKMYVLRRRRVSDAGARL